MSITTKKGDAGMTDILFGQRVRKDDLHIQTVGAMDMFQAQLGVIRARIPGWKKKWDAVKDCKDSTTKEWSDGFWDTLEGVIYRAEIDLQAAMGVCSTPARVENKVTVQWGKLFTDEKIKPMEDLIHSTESVLKEAAKEGEVKCGFLKSNWLVPGSDPVSAQFNLARTYCRHAESCVWNLVLNKYPIDRLELAERVAKWLNRLSDVLFILTRYLAERVIPQYRYWMHERNKANNERKHPKKLFKELKRVKTLTPLQKSLVWRIENAYKQNDLIAQRRDKLVRYFIQKVIKPTVRVKDWKGRYSQYTMMTCQVFLELAQNLSDAVKQCKWDWLEFFHAKGEGWDKMVLDVIIYSSEDNYAKYEYLFDVHLDCLKLKVYYTDYETKTLITEKSFSYESV